MMHAAKALSPPTDRTDDRPGRVGYAAPAWAAGYGVLALIWTLTGTGYPFAEVELSLLRLLPAVAGPPVFAGVLLTTAVAAFAMSGRHAGHLRGVPRALLLGYGWLVAAALLLVVPDTEVLTLTGYAPMLVLGAPFGWPPVDYATIFDWALLNKLIAVAGGLLLARTVLRWQRSTAALCAACGRGSRTDAWTSPASADRWGRWAAYVAAAIPAVYATTRFAWLLGIPLGIDDTFLREMHATGLVWAGAGLGAFAVAGSVLTLGLVQRWGERFPRWMVGLAGRRVPVRLAVIPATLVAIAVAAASLAFLADPDFAARMTGADGASTPILLWPLWSVALGAATYAYWLRRRGACPACGRS